MRVQNLILQAHTSSSIGFQWGREVIKDKV